MINLLLACAALLVPSSVSATPMAAQVASVKGDARVLLDGVEPWIAAAPGQQLTAGSRVSTGLSGEVVLAFGDGSKVRLSRGAQFTLEDSQPSRIAVFLALGRLEAWVSHVVSRQFVARSQAAVASVRGTIFKMEADAKTTTISLFQGSLAVNDSFGRPSLLNTGQQLKATLMAGAGKPAPLPAAERGSAPIEPKVTLTPTVIEEAVEATAEKAQALPVPKDDSKPVLFSPPPNPKQDDTVVSPSAP